MKIHKKIKLNAAMLLIAGTVGFAGANPAQAALCSTITTISDLGAGNSCTTAGGWIFKLNSFSGFGAADSLSFTGGGTPTSFLTYGILQQAGAWTSAGNPYQFNYTITAPPTRLLASYTSSLTSSVSGLPGGDAGSWDVSGTPGAAMATFSTPMGMNGNKSYATNLTADTFTATMNVTSGQIQSVTSTINTKNPPSAVPGPLPLLGAGAAFGFSRRLRNRVKLAA